MIHSCMRGELVLVDFGAPAGSRPALVIQNDRDNSRMANTIVAQVTTNLSRSNEQSQLLIETSHADWDRSGLKKSSVVNCSNLATIRQVDVRRTIGTLSQSTMQHVDDCLKVALSLEA